MPTISFEGDTHDEIVRKVRRWLASIDGEEGSQLSPVEAVEKASEITKDALSIIAAAAPGPVAGNALFRALTRRGYNATDSTKRAVTAGLDALAEVTGGSLVKRAEDARRAAVYEMNAAVAKQVLKSIKGR
jgi:hypothetical protein